MNEWKTIFPEVGESWLVVNNIDVACMVMRRINQSYPPKYYYLLVDYCLDDKIGEMSISSLIEITQFSRTITRACENGGIKVKIQVKRK